MAKSDANQLRAYSIRVLEACGVPLGVDYTQLQSHEVDALHAEASVVQYRKPQHAVGVSKAQCFHDLLQKRAARSLV